MQADMNLLTALDALLEEQSVTGAAERLHLSTPAMSRTLGRIRQATGDAILVRSGRTMHPTPRALAIRDEVHGVVRRGQALLAPEPRLELGTLERTFTVVCHDAIATAIGAELLAQVGAAAPGVTMRLLPEAADDSLGLGRGRVDLTVGASPSTAPHARADRIGVDRLVAAMRPDHPLVEDELTLERYADASHVIVSRRGRTRDRIDDELAAQARHRRVLASVPTSTAALLVALETDALVSVSERLTRSVLRRLGLQTRPIPVELAPVPVVLAWHGSMDADLGHLWLRDVVTQLVRARLLIA